MSKLGAEHTVELIAYTIAEAAAALGLDEARVRDLIRTGVLPHIALGNRRLVGKRALEQWLTEACLANASGAFAVPARPTPLRKRRSV